MGEETTPGVGLKDRARARYQYFRCYDVTPGREKGRKPARYRHFRCYDVTSGREKGRKPARFYDYDVTSGL